jgi:single-strand DNA-binding protein
MKDINSVTLTGRLTKPTDVKEVSNGWAIYTIDLANGYSEKDRDGKWQNKTNFFRCKMFRKGSDFAKYLDKGQMISVSGTLRQETWQDKESGKNRSAVVVMIDSLVLCGGQTRGQTTQKPDEMPMPDEGVPF